MLGSISAALSCLVYPPLEVLSGEERGKCVWALLHSSVKILRVPCFWDFSIYNPLSKQIATRVRIPSQESLSGSLSKPTYGLNLVSLALFHGYTPPRPAKRAF